MSLTGGLYICLKFNIMKMYKSLLFLGLILTTSLASAQQFSEHSLGLRLGDGNGFGSEIS